MLEDFKYQFAVPLGARSSIWIFSLFERPESLEFTLSFKKAHTWTKYWFERKRKNVNIFLQWNKTLFELFCPSLLLRKVSWQYKQKMCQRSKLFPYLCFLILSGILVKMVLIPNLMWFSIVLYLCIQQKRAPLFCPWTGGNGWIWLSEVWIMVMVGWWGASTVERQGTNWGWKGELEESPSRNTTYFKVGLIRKGPKIYFELHCLYFTGFDIWSKNGLGVVSSNYI